MSIIKAAKNLPKQLKPKYLYLDTFVVPTALLLLIQDLPDKDRRIYSFVCSIIITHCSTVENGFPGCFVNVHSSVFAKYWKSHPTQTPVTEYIGNLVSWGIVERNEKYSAGKFSMSYRINPAKNASHARIQFRNRSLMKRTEDLGKYSGNPILSYVHTQLQDLRVIDGPEDHMKVLALSPCRETRAIDSLRDIYSGVGNLKIGTKGGRLFHSVICAVKESRKLLTWSDGSPLVDHDFSTLHPRLIFKYFNDPEERLKYHEMLSGDIYSVVRDWLKNQGMDLVIYSPSLNISESISSENISRPHVKKEMMTFLYSGKQNGVFRFFQHHFPKTILTLEFETMASTLQSLESSVMVQFLCNYCIDNNLHRIIPMHDGWLSDGSSDKAISSLLVSHFDSLVNGQESIRVRFPIYDSKSNNNNSLNDKYVGIV